MGNVAMPLSELMPELLKVDPDQKGWRVDAEWADCDGLWFLCPACYVNNGRSAIGTHMMICWKPHVPQTVTPAPGRWNMVGTSLRDVTLVNGSSSILIQGACCAHFWIRDGNVEDLTWNDAWYAAKRANKP